jgi:hypothetical protein
MLATNRENSGSLLVYFYYSGTQIPSHACTVGLNDSESKPLPRYTYWTKAITQKLFSKKLQSLYITKEVITFVVKMRKNYNSRNAFRGVDCGYIFLSRIRYEVITWQLHISKIEEYLEEGWKNTLTGRVLTSLQKTENIATHNAILMRFRSVALVIRHACGAIICS